MAAAMLVRLSDVRGRDAQACGNKAAALGELSALGYAIPPGLVLPTQVFETFVSENGLQALTQARAAESVTAAPVRLVEMQTEITSAFSRASLPQSVVDEIRAWTDELGGARFAVRSSATNEDLPGASFAGQYDSYLNVEAAGVPDAAVRCMTALFNARAALYRRRKNVTTTGGMAVLIQRMIEAEHAGVVFTRAPGRADAVLLECAPGGADGVVSGTVRPNRYYLDRATLTLRECSGPHPVSWSSVRAAAGQAMAIEAAFSRAQDVEFAAVRDAIHILQARPATIQ